MEGDDEITGVSKLELNEYIPSNYKPKIILTSENNYNEIALEPKTIICSNWRTEVSPALLSS